MEEATTLARRLASELDAEAMVSLNERIDVVELTPQERQLFVDASLEVWTKYEQVFGSELFEAAQRANP